VKAYDVFEVITHSPRQISDGVLSALGVHRFDKEIEAGEKVGITFVLGNGISFVALFLALEIREAVKEGDNETLLLYNLGQEIGVRY